MDKVHTEYLKQMLFQINRFRLGINENDKIDISSLETLKTTKAGLKVLESINSGEYFKMPLVRNQQLTRASTFIKDGFKGVAEKGKLMMEEMIDYFDNREYHEEEKTKLKDYQEGYYEMGDPYNAQSDSFKKEVIDRNGTEYYELNLDTIAQKIAFNKIRQSYINEILPTINSYMW
jgi:hypothetical protein